MRRKLNIGFFTDQLKEGECYSVIMMPFIGSLDSKTGEARTLSAAKGVQFEGGDAAYLLGMLNKNVILAEDVVPGDQYKLIFLMRKTPTSEKFQIYARIMKDRMFICLEPDIPNPVFCELDKNLVDWINKKLINFNGQVQITN